MDDYLDSDTLEQRQRFAKIISDEANSPEGMRLMKADIDKVKKILIKIREGFKSEVSCLF